MNLKRIAIALAMFGVGAIIGIGLLGTTLATTREDLNKAHIQINDLGKTKDRVMEEKRKVEQKFAETEHQLAELNKRVDELTKENEDLKQQLSDKIEELSLAQPVSAEAATTPEAVPQAEPVVQDIVQNATPEAVPVSTGTNSAKEWIAQKESSGSYDATNGQYIGRYQLTASYLNGDYSPANQERVADQYVAGRYGSWEGAQAFWMANGWY